jgi:hypothetical protein
MHRRTVAGLLALLFSVVLAHSGRAAPVQKVAVVAAFGDALSIVTYEPVTGSHLPSNKTQTIAVGDRSFDAGAANAAADALRKASPGWQPYAVMIDAINGANVDSLRKGTRYQLPEEPVRALVQDGVTHIVLITRLRAPAALKVELGTVGTGTLQGIGFYIDRTMLMRRTDTTEISAGFLAPFAYLEFVLVELATGEIVRAARATETTSFPAARGDTGHPWDALDAKQKLAALNTQILAAIDKAVATLAAAQ